VGAERRRRRRREGNYMGYGISIIGKYLVFGLIASAAGLVDLGLLVLVLLWIGTQFFGQAVVIGEPQLSILQYHGAAGERKIK
jgi:hypothetical protein